MGGVGRVEVDECTFTGEVEPAVKKQKKCTSKVWEYYSKYSVTVKTKDGGEEIQVWAKCKKCPHKARAETSRGTKALWNHVGFKHAVKQDQQQLQLGNDEGGENSAVVETYRYDAEASLRKFYLALVMHEYPFVMVEHEYFVDFIKYLRPDFSFKSRTTTRKEILEIFGDEKKKLYEQLKSLSCRFSATMDMWTSNQNKCYMCIIVHWIDDNWHMQKRIVKFINVKGNHTGTNLATEFVKGVMSWNIEKKLCALTLDNASSNDKCVREVVVELNKRYPLICDGAFFHVRCLCDILNLVAQDGLKVIASSVKNIRATIVIVKNSPLQWDEFQKCAEECDLDNKFGLPLDVPTRWNSTYEMLSHAIYYKRAFERLFLNEGKYEKCSPTNKEWDIADALCKCLQKFNDATVIFSENQYPTANLFWWKFCEIKMALAEWCESADDTISCMAEAMKAKYDKYWDKSNMALAVGPWHAFLIQDTRKSWWNILWEEFIMRGLPMKLIALWMS